MEGINFGGPQLLKSFVSCLALVIEIFVLLSIRILLFLIPHGLLGCSLFVCYLPMSLSYFAIQSLNYHFVYIMTALISIASQKTDNLFYFIILSLLLLFDIMAFRYFSWSNWTLLPFRSFNRSAVHKSPVLVLWSKSTLRILFYFTGFCYFFSRLLSGFSLLGAFSLCFRLPEFEVTSRIWALSASPNRIRHRLHLREIEKNPNSENQFWKLNLLLDLGKQKIV